MEAQTLISLQCKSYDIVQHCYDVEIRFHGVWDNDASDSKRRGTGEQTGTGINARLESVVFSCVTVELYRDGARLGH